MSACPYCQQNLDEGVCEHWVASLNDDDDGYDTVTPLYFGWIEHFSEAQARMMVSLDSYFEAVCALCDQFAKEGLDVRKKILRKAKGLPRIEKGILRKAFKVLDQPGAKEMKDVFTDLFLRCGKQVSMTDWEIADRPGLTWSGTNYCAEDPTKCVLTIIRECGKATDRIRKLIDKRDQ